MGAQIIDLSKTMMTIQICETPERVEMFLETFKTISIVEITRTGTLAVPKCNEGI